MDAPRPGTDAAGRLFSPSAGLLAALVFLSTPWIDRISIIALAESGITCFPLRHAVCTLMALEKIEAGLSPSRWSLLTGLLAGSAIGCKYTGLMQVVIPAAIGLAAALWFAGQLRGAASRDATNVGPAKHTRGPRARHGGRLS